MRKVKQLIIYFIQQSQKEAGAAAVMFAIMFPMVLMFYSMAFDGAKIQAERARLADGLNEGVLAVAITDNQNATSDDKQRNKDLIGSYLKYYLPGGRVLENELNITTNIYKNPNNKNEILSIDYSASGSTIVQPVIANKSGSNAPGFNKNINIKADSGAGVVRRTYTTTTTPTDYVFVTDFSGSMDDPSAQPGMVRIALLKSVVNAFATSVLKADENTTIGIVPFSIGVPVVTNRKNLAGGNEVGCSFVGKLLDKYKNVDLDFWYNKAQGKMSDDNMKTAAYKYDDALYDQYKGFISSATGKTITEMVALGWCKKNSDFGSKLGHAKYSCDADPRSRLSDHQDEFKKSYFAAYYLMASAMNNKTIANVDTMDFKATFEDDPGYIFSEESVTTYTHYYTDKRSNRPFTQMCNNALPTTSAKGMKTVTKPNSYLIELTSDVNVLNEFNKMTVGGNTDSSSGLLRAIPVIAKGTNPRKIIMVISDGADSPGSKEMTEILHEKYKICDRIKSGLLKYPSGTTTKESDIYYISLVDGLSANNRIEFWANNCTGKDNAIIATKYEELLNTLIGISRKGSVKYINKNES